jgi:hypothetical protein
MDWPAGGEGELDQIQLYPLPRNPSLLIIFAVLCQN